MPQTVGTEQALNRALKVLKKTQAALLKQEKLASIGYLAAGIAHEVNNSISYLHGNLGRLQEYVAEFEATLDDSSLKTPLNMKQRQRAKQLLQEVPELLQDCQEGVDRVQDIVQNLSDYSRSEEVDSKTQTDLNALLQKNIRLVNNELKYHCQLDLQLKPIPSVVVHQGQISQVFTNLFLNANQAIKATGKMGSIQISSRHEAPSIIIDISDTGCGIAPHHLDKIFDAFFTTKPAGEGTGLGMSICRDIIEAHGGKIFVTSEPNQGATFSIQLPDNLT